jgi:hypothetical protein
MQSRGALECDGAEGGTSAGSPTVSASRGGLRLGLGTNGRHSKADGAEGGTSAGSPTASALRAGLRLGPETNAGASRRTAPRAGPARARRLRRHCARVHAWHRRRTAGARRRTGRGRNLRRLADCVGVARDPRLEMHRTRAFEGGQGRGGTAPAGRLRRHRARSTLGTGIERRAREGGRRRGRDQRWLADCVGVARGPRLTGPNGGRSKAGGSDAATRTSWAGTAPPAGRGGAVPPTTGGRP